MEAGPQDKISIYSIYIFGIKGLLYLIWVLMDKSSPKEGPSSMISWPGERVEKTRRPNSPCWFLAVNHFGDDNNVFGYDCHALQQVTQPTEEALVRTYTNKSSAEYTMASADLCVETPRTVTPAVTEM